MSYVSLVGASMLAAAALVAAPTLASAQSTSDKVEQKVDKAADKAKSATDKMGQKVEKATDKVESAAREAKADVSDSWITAKTKIALFADERVKGRQVKVETKGGTVLLMGKVDSGEAKAAAESIAKGIDGVKSVKNDLQVVAPAERKMAEANDKEITKAVKDRFAQDPQLKKINVRSDGGVVILTGETPSIDVSARASEIAREVPGVRSVRNEVTYKDRPMAMRSDRKTSDTPGSLRGGSQQHIRVAQESLQKAGYDPGPIDGVYGPRTGAALRAYQKAEGLQVTGQPDPDTLGKLGIGVGGAGESPKKKQSP